MKTRFQKSIGSLNGGIKRTNVETVNRSVGTRGWGGGGKGEQLDDRGQIFRAVEILLCIT